MPNDKNAEYEFLAAVAISEDIGAFEAATVPFCSTFFTAQNVLAIKFHREKLPEILFRWIPDADLRATFDLGYEKLGYMLDPFFQRAFSISDWEACPLRAIAPDRFETSEYYFNYFRATNMVDELGLVARMAEDVAVHLSIGRNFGQRRFRSNEIAKFQLLAKILAPKMRQILVNQAPEESRNVLSLEHRFHALSKSRNQQISLREAEVAALIVQGHSSRAIGMTLGISSHTVKVHRRSLYKKLGISSQNELFGLLAQFAEFAL